MLDGLENASSEMEEAKVCLSELGFGFIQLFRKFRYMFKELDMFHFTTLEFI